MIKKMKKLKNKVKEYIKKNFIYFKEEYKKEFNQVLLISLKKKISNMLILINIFIKN